MYVGVDAAKHVQLSISSEPTGLVVLQLFDRVALTIAQREMLRKPGKQDSFIEFLKTKKLNAGFG